MTAPSIHAGREPSGGQAVNGPDDADARVMADGDGEQEADFRLPRRATQAVVGLAFAAAGVGYTAMSVNTLEPGSLSEPGAGLFPLAIGPLLALSGLGFALERPAPDASPDIGLPRGATGRKALALLAMLAAYMALLQTLGSLVGSVLLAFGAMWLLAPRRSVVRIALYAIVMAVACHVVFVRLLQVPMPRGFLPTF